ncbi:hypothetical protein Tco_1569987 [Tanacetum coccineum]
MLDMTNFESWQQQSRLYCKGKDHGEYILQSIDEGPFKMGKCRDEIASGPDVPYLGPERDRVFTYLSQPEKDRLKADVRATNILLQGLPRDIYQLINHNTDAKDIWDNVKMLLEGSELTKDDRESSLHITMTMPKILLKSKFINYMLPEWGRFVTAIKLNKGLKESNHDQLYAFLKQHEYSPSSSVPPQPSYIPPVTYQPRFADNTPLNTGPSRVDELLDSLSKQVALLAQQYKTQFPQTNNQLRTSSNKRNQATVQNGRVVVQNV